MAWIASSVRRVDLHVRAGTAPLRILEPVSHRHVGNLHAQHRAGLYVRVLDVKVNEFHELGLQNIIPMPRIPVGSVRKVAIDREALLVQEADSLGKVGQRLSGDGHLDALGWPVAREEGQVNLVGAAVAVQVVHRGRPVVGEADPEALPVPGEPIPDLTVYECTVCGHEELVLNVPVPRPDILANPLHGRELEEGFASEEVDRKRLHISIDKLPVEDVPRGLEGHPVSRLVVFVAVRAPEVTGVREGQRDAPRIPLDLCLLQAGPLTLMTCCGTKVGARRPGAGSAAVIPTATARTLAHGDDGVGMDVGYGSAQSVELLLFDNERHFLSFPRIANYHYPLQSIPL